MRQWASDLLGSDDWLTAYMFDKAVHWAGTHVDNKLNEYDKVSKTYPNTIDSILGTPPKKQGNVIADLARMSGGVKKVENGKLKAV